MAGTLEFRPIRPDTEGMSNQRTTTTARQTILDEIQDFMRRYVVFPNDDHAPVIAAWVMHTHCFDAAYATGYLYVHSAEMQSGKTRVIDTLETIVRNPSRMMDATAAGLYKQIEAERPTLMIDEVDAIYAGNKNESLRGVLNGGYKPSGYVVRNNPQYDASDENDSPVIRYSTFSPKLLAGIDNGAIPGTVLDRCIPIQLKRKRSDETVERFLSRKVEPIAEELREKIAAWATPEMIAKLADAEPTIEEGMSDRQWEISEPLIAIAEAVSPKWGKAVRKSLLNIFQGVNPAKSEQSKVLSAIRELLEQHPDRKRILTSEICSHLGGDWNGKRLSGVLAPYGIFPKNVRVGGQQGKGFSADQFEDAFARYL